MGNLWEQGWDRWLRKGEALTEGPVLSSDTAVEGISAVAGGSGVSSASTDNIINDGLDASKITAGEMAALIGYGKKTFTDTNAGYLMGLDSDGIYKFIIGDSSSSMDWAVTTAATLTVNGTIVATAGSIGGWTITATTLHSGSNITLDSTNKSIWINDSTFGNSGIQLEYNSGTPRFYVGDGTTYFFKYDGTNISWGASATTLSTAGLLTTTSATIGGWNVVSGYIYNLQSGTPTSSPNDGIVLASGNEGIIVYEDTAKRAELGFLSTGVYGLKVYATNGTDVIFEASDTQQKVAGWYFDTTSLSDNTTAANAKIYIDSANTLIRAGATTGDYLTIDGANLRIRSSNYVTGSAGAGFTLEPDLLEVGNIAARGIIRTAVFQKDVISSVGGTIVVLDSDVLNADMSALDASTLTIAGNTTFAVGDLLRIKDGTDDEWLEVTSVASAPEYTVTRDKGAAYGADANPAWTKGATVVNYKQSGDGGLLLTASETNAPYMTVFTHAGAPWTTITTQTRLGNLNGFLDYASDIYGLAIGSSATTNANITIDPTNGIRIRNGTTNKMLFDNSGNATFYGTVEVTSGSNEKVVISAGAVTGYASDGTSEIWRFLQDPSYNNVMTIWKRDFSPSYGNALSIFEYSTDVNHTFDISTDSGVGTGNASKCLMSLFANCETLYNNFQLISTLTDQSSMMYAVKNSGDLNKAMIHLDNKTSDGEGICIDQLGTLNPNSALIINNKGTNYAIEVYSENCNDEAEYAMIKWSTAVATNTGRWALERVDHVTDDFCMKLGAYYFWVDTNGKYRIMSGRPTSDTDGAIVGLSGGLLTGSITFDENTSLIYDSALSADGKYCGETVGGTAGTALAFGDLVYLDPTDSKWELADANSAAAADGDCRGILGICVLAANENAATTILLRGMVRADTAFPALTVNAAVYADETAGDVVVTQPTTSGVVIRIVGQGFDANTLYFNPSPDWIVHT